MVTALFLLAFVSFAAMGLFLLVLTRHGRRVAGRQRGPEDSASPSIPGDH